jgi:hypothetical protein
VRTEKAAVVKVAAKRGRRGGDSGTSDVVDAGTATRAAAGAATPPTRCARMMMCADESLMTVMIARSVGANVCACSASGRVAAAEDRVLPVRVNGSTIGDFRYGGTQDEILHMLKYHADAREYFKFPELTVSTTLESDGKRVHVVHVPAESGFISVEVLHVLSGDEDEVFTPSGPSAIDCEPFDGTSVTHTGQLRMTSAFIDKPAVRMSGGGLLQRILSHPMLSFLDGVDCILVEQRESSWIRVKLFDPKSPPAKLGIVVRRSNVRVVKLMFDDVSIPTILRQDSGDSVNDAVKESCDWRAWPAVSACTEPLTLYEASSIIRVSGEYRVTMHLFADRRYCLRAGSVHTVYCGSNGRLIPSSFDVAFPSCDGKPHLDVDMLPKWDLRAALVRMQDTICA